jgi:hypothetical protein
MLCLFQAKQGRERRFVLGLVFAGCLAQGGRVGDQIQHVVLNLESQADAFDHSDQARANGFRHVCGNASELTA